MVLQMLTIRFIFLLWVHLKKAGILRLPSGPLSCS
jgi:hypothetical protein